MDIHDARKKFHDLRLRGEAVDPRDLDELWAALPPVRIEDILGRWKGSVFATGHPGTRQLQESRWYGKTFRSVLDAKPLIRYDGNGALYSDTTTANGEASLWMVEFRGEVTATMVYDGIPVFDHFKRVDDDTLFGIMNGKGDLLDADGHPLYFILSTRDDPE
ncbi:DUF4334 domain-containing protein [Actinomadura rubrisoli]|uniref:DUF4334 domain-containing protein n=1 Tax=Actinomadura rubrisoli TaxID=2530368 RepID=A0A4R5BGA7_9ACTN|nr:DUF4334 domain-containing protein [Actinomadura rubrisoli]TDD84479.1 DUF4334 domain-containing protein [Actinomadura rubrisoli]